MDADELLKKAVELLRERQLEDPSGPTLSATAWFYKGEEMDKQGYSAEALSCFEKALAIPRRLYVVRQRLALGKLGRPKDELACYERALALNASFPEAWLNKAIGLGNARRFREAPPPQMNDSRRASASRSKPATRL